MGEFNKNPDIDEKPPISLRDALEKMKPFLMAYENIESQEEWEVYFVFKCYFFSADFAIVQFNPASLSLIHAIIGVWVLLGLFLSCKVIGLW